MLESKFKKINIKNLSVEGSEKEFKPFDPRKEISEEERAILQQCIIAEEDSVRKNNGGLFTYFNSWYFSRLIGIQPTVEPRRSTLKILKAFNEETSSDFHKIRDEGLMKGAFPYLRPEATGFSPADYNAAKSYSDKLLKQGWGSYIEIGTSLGLLFPEKWNELRPDDSAARSLGRLETWENIRLYRSGQMKLRDLWYTYYFLARTRLLAPHVDFGIDERARSEMRACFESVREESRKILKENPYSIFQCETFVEMAAAITILSAYRAELTGRGVEIDIYPKHSDIKSKKVSPIPVQRQF